MTVEEFCKTWRLTAQERRQVIEYLAFLRMQATLKLIEKGAES